VLHAAGIQGPKKLGLGLPKWRNREENKTKEADDRKANKEGTKEISGLKVEEFIWISYKTEILNWLEKSAKEAYGLPNIQYILDHYIKIIKYLTNQNSNNKMKEEILEFILSS
jgi:hypothetical protein